MHYQEERYTRRVTEEVATVFIAGAFAGVAFIAMFWFARRGMFWPTVMASLAFFGAIAMTFVMWDRIRWLATVADEQATIIAGYRRDQQERINAAVES